MGGTINIYSLLRRALGRLSEFVFLGEIGEAMHIIPGFHVEFFGRFVAGYVLILMSGSALFDLVEITTRPILGQPPCAEIEPELPLDEEK